MSPARYRKHSEDILKEVREDLGFIWLGIVDEARLAGLQPAMNPR